MPSRPFVQLAYLVDDAERAAHAWANARGAGPFFLFRHIRIDAVSLLGAPAELDHSSAYGQLGDIMIELVENHTPGPSVFAGRTQGVHHAAYFADDLDAELARLEVLGVPTAMTARTANGVRFAFADANASLGHYLEVYHPHPDLARLYAVVRKAADGWRGDSPVRYSLG